jgi:mRNA-degrading endonuclease RelE of RelBE toxin-antitoxin system
MYRILVSRTFQKAFQSLNSDSQERIRTALEGLSEDPFHSRSGVDIKPLIHTQPKKYRLRIGELRIVYYVKSNTILLIDLFHRGQGYIE